MNKPPPKICRNNNQLAKALGITRMLVGHHRKNPLAPKELDVEKWKGFLAALGRIGTAPDELLLEISKRKLSILATKDEKEKDELEISRGNLIQIREVIIPFLNDIIGNDIFSEWERLSRELPPNLVGLDAAQMFVVFRKEKERMKQHLLEKVQAWIDAQKAKDARKH